MDHNLDTHKPGDASRSSRRREVLLLAGILVLALAVRLAYHYEMRNSLIVDHLQLDEQFHDRWARSIATGNIRGEGVFFRAPLYPYMLGLLYAVTGAHADAARIVQHFLGVAIVLVTFLLTRLLFGTRSALIAAVLAALYAVMICFEGRLLFELPLTLLVIVWLLLVIRLADRLSRVHYAIFGLLFGLICTMRPPFLALAVPLFGYILWYYVRGRASILRYAVPLVLAFAAPIFLVATRNAMVGDDLVLLASQGGINFYIGNNPQSDGYSPTVHTEEGIIREYRGAEYIAEKSLGHPPRPSEVSAYWYHRGLEFMFGDPGGFVRLFLRKAYLFWSHIEIVNNLSYYSYERSSQLLSWLPVGFWLVGPLGLAGAIYAWKERRARLLHLFLLSYFLATVAFFVCDRFRIPVVPVLFVFAGYAVHNILLAATARRWKSFLQVVALVAVGAVLVNTNLCRVRADAGLGKEEVEAQSALESGRLAAAAGLFSHIATVDPENPGARVNQGIALWGMGKTAEAAAAFRAGIRNDPYSAFLNLAHLYFNLQKVDTARFYAARAIRAQPFSPGGYIISAKCSIVQGDLPGAASILVSGGAACAHEFVYGEYLLAGIYLQSENLEAADSLYREVLGVATGSRQPEYVIQSEEARFGEDLATLRGKALHALGRLFAARNQLDSSEVYLHAAARQLPLKADVWADWGVCLLRLNRLEEADTVMRRALIIGGDNAGVWLNYATLLLRKGEPGRARAAVSTALALRPDLEEARRLMSLLSTKQSPGAGLTK